MKSHSSREDFHLPLPDGILRDNRGYAQWRTTLNFQGWDCLHITEVELKMNFCVPSVGSLLGVSQLKDGSHVRLHRLYTSQPFVYVPLILRGYVNNVLIWKISRSRFSLYFV